MTDEERATAMARLFERNGTGKFVAAFGQNYCRITFDLKPVTQGRTKIEMGLRAHFPSYWAKGQIVAIAFLGRSSDDKVSMYFAKDGITSANLREIRQTLEDTDIRASVFYPVQALV